MNAINFLMKEHNHVRKILREIDNHSHRYETKRKMFDSLGLELIRHETMEHQIWYPHFKNKLNKEIEHLVSEEKAAERAIHQFDSINTQQAWEEKFSKFKRDVENHAREEELRLFPEVKRLLSHSQLETIGKQMYQYKRNHPTKQ